MLSFVYGSGVCRVDRMYFFFFPFALYREFYFYFYGDIKFFFFSPIPGSFSCEEAMW